MTQFISGKKITSLLVLIVFSGAICFAQKKNDDLKIWFTRPAAEWNEAFPVGNGRLGAMVFGGVESERLQLNEESVWTGADEDFYNPQSKEGLKEVRELLFAGKYAEAEKVAQKKILGNKQNHPSTYQTMGDLILHFNRPKSTGEYRRELDIENAMAKVSYQADRINYTREIFSSYPDQVLVVRMDADKEGALSFTARLRRPGNKATIKVNANEITMTEHVGDDRGVVMFARLHIITEGGTIQQQGDSLHVEQANAVTLLLAGATNYHGKNPEEVTRKQLDEVSGKNYADLKQRHIADYKKYFDRVAFNIGTTDAVYFATDARIDALKNGNVDPQLIQLYYQFGRYLLISSSRPGSLPANLQGIWADGLWPPWSADYHININIQMNYWPVEITNLSELHMPFLKFISALRDDGRKTAKDAYGLQGIVAHYTTDAWHFTEPEGRVNYAMWPMGINWSCQHLWEHYLFTEDKKYLKELAYPTMKEAVQFVMDWLVRDPKTKKLVSGPSISPENRFKTADGKTASMVMGPTMDQMIIWDLLTNTIAASKIVNDDASFRKKMEKTLANLATMQIGGDGRLMEWTEEFQEAEPGHRHISHLFGLYPGKQITKQKSPEFMDAARKTIDYRLSHGGGHTGWSRAWIINFFARLQDGEAAYENLQALLAKSTLHNLFDTHPPFQIDGNFGATAGITEMLLQSHAGEVHLLPALPKAWPTGYIRGLMARGGFEISMDWDNGTLKKVSVLSKLGNTCKMRFGEKVIEFETEKSQTYVFDGNLDKL